MRRRVRRRFPVVVLAGLALVLPQAPATAAPRPEPAAQVGARSARSVTLPTGQHVRLTGAAGRERVLVDHGTARGPGRTLLTRRLQAHVYAFPAVAEPYLGRFLDPSLFDVTGLQAAATPSGRVPVRLTYRGDAPKAPGIHITSASGGSARGYLTPSSAALFGRALSDQWLRDRKAGWPRHASLFTGVTGIRADVATPRHVRPHFPMHTLTVKVLDPSGKPQALGGALLLNVDDGRKYAGFATVENGEARVSVPAGHYAAISDDFAFDEATETGDITITTVNEYSVQGPGQTLTLDHRKATVRPSATTPRPASTLDAFVEWDRTDAAETGLVGSGYFVDASTRLALAPAAKPKRGTVSLVQSWTLGEPTVAVPTYLYSLASHEDRIPAVMRYAFAAREMGTLRAAYYGDGSTAPAAFSRAPFYAGAGGGGTYEPVPRGTRRTEYVGAKGSALWADSALINNDSFDDPGFLDGPARRIPAGSATSVSWFRGPLAPAIPVQPNEGVCYGCRYGNTIGLFLAPWTDSDPTHVGAAFAAEDGLPVARFRWYRNDKLLSDQDDTSGGEFEVKAGKANYRAVLDVDRRLTGAAQSIRSQTSLTFSSAKGTGRKLPRDWFCLGDSCRVLPIVQARVALPTDLNGRLPVGRSTVTVTVARVQQAASSPAKTAKLEIREQGARWRTVTLTSIGGGRFRGAITHDRESAGSGVDIRVFGADQGGSTFQQTVLRAYTVAGPR